MKIEQIKTNLEQEIEHYSTIKEGPVKGCVSVLPILKDDGRVILQFNGWAIYLYVRNQSKLISNLNLQAPQDTGPMTMGAIAIEEKVRSNEAVEVGLWDWADTTSGEHSQIGLDI